MRKPDFLKNLAKEFTENLPSHVQTLKKDMEKHCHSAMKTVFSKLEVVSREEFDVQSKVLARTRKKLEALEELVKQLEKKKQK